MKLMAGLSVGEWGLAVEEARASGCKDISHLDHLKMHSIDVSQAVGSSRVYGASELDTRRSNAE